MMRCPARIDLTRALSEGASPELAAHLSSCASCRTQHQSLGQAISLARGIDAPLPSSSRVESARTSLLAAATLASPPGSTRGRGRRIWVGTLAAAILVVVVTSRPASRTASATHRHGTIAAHPAASFTHASSTPDEIVTLHAGTLDVDVAPLHAGERFRVLVGDAEIEVHGTAFTVVAAAGHLTELVVHHGRVSLHSPSESRMLTAGQSWRAPILTAAIVPAPVVPAPVGPAVVVRAPVTAARVAAAPAPVAAEPAPAKRLPEALAYDDAWTDMRSNNFTDAARAFARVQALAPSGPLAEDAGFWYAVALARSSQPTLATAAFRDHLATFPRSRRVGEASAMLGWLLLEAGDAREASARFRAAITDANPDVRASAQAGLAALQRDVKIR